jgi:UrcA family protein
MKFNYKTVIATTAFIAMMSPLMASAAIKSSQIENTEITVVYNAAELSSTYGRARVETLVRQAARQVCGDVSLRQAGSLRNASANKTCYNDAVEKAMNTVEGLAITGI